MATTTKKSAAKQRAAQAKGKTTKAASRKASRKATEGKTSASAEDRAAQAEARRAARATRDAEHTERMLEMREEGTSWSEIGTELGITPGKAQFLNMLHLVATGEVKPLRFKAGDEEALAKVIATEREKAYEYSSWGWISARTGVSEPKLKSVHEAHNGWKPKTENIAIERAEKNGDAKTTAKGRSTRTDGKAKATATKAAKAKAKARGRGKQADPTS